MRKNISIPLKICLTVYFLVLAAFLSRIIFFTDFMDFINIGRTVSSCDYSTDWIIDSGEQVNLKDFAAGSRGGSYSVSKILPDDMLETDSVYLSTSNIKLDIYVDNDLIYSYDTRENLTGKGDGVTYHMIGLGSKDEGKTIRIDIATVFDNRHGGRINEVYFGPEEQFRYYMMRSNLVGDALSALMVVFGIVVLTVYFMVSKTSSVLRSLWALGITAILFGFWSLCDIGMPQLLSGTVYACREVVYGLPHLAIFPLIYFVNYVTRPKRKIFLYLSYGISLSSFAGLVFSRYVFGADLHTMTEVVYFSYVSGLIIFVALLVDNEIVCRKKKTSSNLKYFYIGAAIFIITSFIDIFRYLVGKKVSIGRGSWFRFGLVLFFVFMAFQIFDWWKKEKSSLERDRFINHLLQYIMTSMDPDERINKVLEYMCNELHADRAYIFEDMKDGTFDNTYEYCAKGVVPEIDNLKGIKYKGVIDSWYDEYKKGGHILIYDIEKYRDVNENMYNVLKPQGIETLVTGPLILEGEYIGFFGVDNPPLSLMTEISEIIRLLMFFISELVARRDNHRCLVEYSYKDALTGLGNRRAIREYENNSLDTSRSYGYIMCDINGLKNVNDSKGHDAGDELICGVASCLREVFRSSNIYRMGGDEFAVYVYADTYEEFAALVDKTKAMLEDKGYYVAIGISYAEGGDPDYHKHKTEADNKMYEEKRRFYNDDKHDRRSYD